MNKLYVWLEKGIAAFSFFRIVVKELLMLPSPCNGAE